MSLNNNQILKKILVRCAKSVSFFIDNFCSVKHPKLGIIPFKLFSYQKNCLLKFKKNRFVIFKKTRQCGISTITGAYALWYAMFHSNKTILIVSKRDLDATTFLGRNVKFVYSNLPEWMKNLFPLEKSNEHELVFKNGSVIRSLTSSPDTLRSNASSLNIIDEAAFMQHMDTMWAGGWPTIQTGGSVIVISTTNGIGNWYWKTWTEAVSSDNDFEPITINWWDMDWHFEFTDELSGKVTRIAPVSGLRECNPKEKEKYGPFWSPWLEEQYRALATKGNDAKFRQEVLAEFIGTGNTVLSRQALIAIQEMVEDADRNYEPMTLGTVNYVNPNTQEPEVLDFQEEIQIWKKPYTSAEARKTIEAHRKNGTLHELSEADRRPHVYTLGADVSTGEANDYSSIQILDVDTQEQVAELKIKTLPKFFAKMIDYLGRWYNNALAVVERTGIGATVCQDLNDELVYPNLYRYKKTTASLKTKYQQIGFPTSNSTKPMLVKKLTDFFGVDGIDLKSYRLYHELCIFINLGNGRYGNESGDGNNDDLVISAALALIGIEEAIQRSNSNLAPIHHTEFGQIIDRTKALKTTSDFIVKGGKNVLPPVNVSSEMYSGKPDKAEELTKFMSQLGGFIVPPDMKSANLNKRDPVSVKKHIIKYPKN